MDRNRTSLSHFVWRGLLLAPLLFLAIFFIYPLLNILGVSLAPQGQFDLLHTPLGGGVGQAIGKPWQSVSIDGNADVALVVTYSREADRDAVAKQRNDGKVPAYIQAAIKHVCHVTVPTS